jgi:hypothetical protein
LGNLHDAQLKDLLRGQTDETTALEPDLAQARLHETTHRFEQRRLARTVGTDDARDTTLAHVKVDALEHVAPAVTGDDALES